MCPPPKKNERVKNSCFYGGLKKIDVNISLLVSFFKIIGYFVLITNIENVTMFSFWAKKDGWL
jgi:hypothetical protein